MEPRHRAKVRGQGFALARLKLLDEVIHGLLDDYLSGVVFLARALLIRRVAAGPLRRIFPVRRGVVLAVPLLAVVAAMLVVPLLNSMMMLLL